MKAARKISRRFGRTTGMRTRSAAGCAIVAILSLVPTILRSATLKYRGVVCGDWVRMFVLLLAVINMQIVWAALVPDGWLTTIDSNAAIRAVNDYTSNTVRCVWAGDNPRVASALPANVAFQLAICGPEHSVSNAQKFVDEICTAIPEELQSTLKSLHLFAPTIQWIVRSGKCAALGGANYFGAEVHPAAFAEKDFSTNSLAFARNLRIENVPPAVVFKVFTEETSRHYPLLPTIPGVDYPDVHPETTFATPFGIGLVIRAPESPRIFKIKAGVFPDSKMKASFKWVILSGGGGRIEDWRGNRRKEGGYGLVMVDVRALFARRRVDVAVFARLGDGPWGVPSIISFYASPYEVRTYQQDKLVMVQYIPKARMPPPYDISEICTPAKWTDVYLYDSSNQITGFSRLMPDSISSIDFSSKNERIIESYSNAQPKIAEKIRYFIKDGQICFEETGEEVRYKFDTFHPRRLLIPDGLNRLD